MASPSRCSFHPSPLLSTININAKDFYESVPSHDIELQAVPQVDMNRIGRLHKNDKSQYVLNQNDSILTKMDETVRSELNNVQRMLHKKYQL